MYDVVVIGGGQAGLAIGYYIAKAFDKILDKTKLNYLILDENPKAGGAWLHTWDSLTLFSPANNSTLPGWFMPKSNYEYPTKDEVIEYLAKYEERYKLNIIRNIKVLSVESQKNTDDTFYLIKCSSNNCTNINHLEHSHSENNKSEFKTKFIINATGNFSNQFLPSYPNIDKYLGEIIHSAQYRNPMEYSGKKVLIVGGANSAAQILSEVSLVTIVKWSTLKPPIFLPDDIDGRYLFNSATEVYKSNIEKKSNNLIVGFGKILGDIVMVPSVKDARNRNVLNSSGKIVDFYSNGIIWENGDKGKNEFEEFDVVIFCTGFKNNLFHLQNMPNMFDENGKVILKQRDFIKEQLFESQNYPNIYFIGYGNWTGFASATLIGVGRFAKSLVAYIIQKLN